MEARLLLAKTPIFLDPRDWLEPPAILKCFVLICQISFLLFLFFRFAFLVSRFLIVFRKVKKREVEDEFRRTDEKKTSLESNRREQILPEAN